MQVPRHALTAGPESSLVRVPGHEDTRTRYPVDRPCSNHRKTGALVEAIGDRKKALS